MNETTHSHPGRRRLRVPLVLTAVAALLAVLTVRPTEAATDDPLAHVRLTLDSTSDWSTAQLSGVEVVTANVVPGPGDDRAYLTGASLTVVGTAPSTATVDLLVRVSDRVALRLDKGYDGTATARLERMDTPPVGLAKLDDDLHTGDHQVVTIELAPEQLIGDGVTVPVVDDRRLTLAFYYPWWPDGSMRSRPFLDRPASAWRTDDPGDVSVMVDQARGAGLDGFLVSWGGEETDGEELDLVMDAAAARGDFSVGALLELLPHVHDDVLGRSHLDVQAAVTAARAALDRSSRKEYLHVGDRPVLAAFGVDRVPEAEWQRFRQALAPVDPFLLGDSTDPSRGLDGVYLYDPNEPSAAELESRYQGIYRSTHLSPIVHPELPVRLFAATVSPGKGMTLAAPTRTRNRESGARYDRLWRIATRSHPEWILVTSWNEWYESTHIAPSADYGWEALQQTTTWTSRFHG